MSSVSRIQRALFATSDNGYSVNFGTGVLHWLSAWFAFQAADEFPFELLEHFHTFWRGLHDLVLPLEDLSSGVTRQDTDGVVDLPSGSSKNSQAGIGVALQQCDALAFADSNCSWKPIEALNIKTSCVEVLQYLGGIRHASP